MRKGRVQVLQLHGSLARELQDRAIRGGGGNRTQGARRVILSTPIAESSVTIDGVRVVVDSGLRRSPAYDVQTGRVDGHPPCGSGSWRRLAGKQSTWEEWWDGQPEGRPTSDDALAVFTWNCLASNN